jgi:hypothetical protein
VFVVGLRDDDRDILTFAERNLGLGQVYERPAYRSSRPQVVWALNSKLECAALAEFLDAHPFRGRKLREYEMARGGGALDRETPWSHAGRRRAHGGAGEEPRRGSA